MVSAFQTLRICPTLAATLESKSQDVEYGALHMIDACRQACFVAPIIQSDGVDFCRRHVSRPRAQKPIGIFPDPQPLIEHADLRKNTATAERAAKQEFIPRGRT